MSYTVLTRDGDRHSDHDDIDGVLCYVSSGHHVTGSGMSSHVVGGDIVTPLERVE